MYQVYIESYVTCFWHTATAEPKQYLVTVREREREREREKTFYILIGRPIS